MSWARFGEDSSDVYIYEDLDGRAICAACRLAPPDAAPGGDCILPSAAAVRAHFAYHVRAGHTIPARAYARLEAAEAAAASAKDTKNAHT